LAAGKREAGDPESAGFREGAHGIMEPRLFDWLPASEGFEIHPCIGQHPRTNSAGGERRLNVAITRATTEVVVFASFDASMIDLTRTSAQAVKDLKHYLDFAERGPVALGEAIRAVGGRHAYDSDFEAAVAAGLRQRGWNVATQIGVSRFRIDLGIVHPDAPGRFLAGAECDGTTYHSSPSARDRDRVRHIILEQLGWRLFRIWSTDFFADPEGELKRVHDRLEALLAKDRAAVQAAEDEARAKQEAETARPSDSDERPDRPNAAIAREAGDDGTGGESKSREATAAHRVAAADPTPSSRHSAQFTLWDAGTHAVPAADPDRFYEPGYRPKLRAMTATIIDREGPITFKRLTPSLSPVPTASSGRARKFAVSSGGPARRYASGTRHRMATESSGPLGPHPRPSSHSAGFRSKVSNGIGATSPIRKSSDS